MTDVLGVCESWTEGPGGKVVVRREKGDLVEIAVADIVSGKPVPPRPSVHRRLGAAEADRRALPGWRAVEEEDLGDWVLRASSGFSSRGSSVLTLGEPSVPLEEAVHAVSRWYAERGLPARAHVLPGTEQADAFLAAGWHPYEQTDLMLASVSRVLRRLGPVDERPRHGVRLDEAWLATDERAARHGDAARTVLEAGEVTFCTLQDAAGEVLARGRGAFHGDWVGVSSLWTRPDLRGSGLGTAVLGSLLEWGAERGATTAYLQVVTRNDAARSLYESRGFEVHHRYDYVVDDPAAPVP